MSTYAIDMGRRRWWFRQRAERRIWKWPSRCRCEWVLQVTGKVAKRPEGAANPKLATGEIEVRVEKLTMLNRSATPPFLPTAQDLPGEDLRLKYRFLDLRRPEMQRTLELRHRIITTMREYFDRNGFLDVETPVLGRSTPEGARDYLVPSRIQHGMFYALPQSPQLYKQILMVAGYDRYVQVARCFRDEDLRADRQPEFTQLDMEMSFVEADDVIGMIDGLVQKLAKEVLGLDVKLPLPRMTYDEAMERFGHDAPDLRFGLELIDVSDLAKEAEFRVFRGAVDGGGKVRGINAKGAAAKYSRKDIDEMTAWVCQVSGAKGLAWFKVEESGTLASPIAKNFTPELLARISARMQAAPGDFLLFVADSYEVTCKALHNLRKKLGEELKLYEPGAMNFSWVVEFPMFAWDAEEKTWAAMHHPFTAPRPQDAELLKTEPGKCRAQAYDLVINGSEAGGGTIRIHDQELQQQVFELLGIDRQKGAGAVRVFARRAAIRRTAAWRDRARDRSVCNVVREARQHSRLHCVPENAEGDRFDDRGAERGRCETASRAGDFDCEVTRLSVSNSRRRV